MLDSKLFKEYPRVAIVADNFGFSYEDIESLIRKISSDSFCCGLYRDEGRMELALRAMIVRMNMSRDEFFNHIKLNATGHIQWTQGELHNAKEYIGAYQLPAYCAILA